MLGKNPSVIEPPPKRGPGASTAPLVLIHDGGGTCISYHFLGSLGRPVYGIHNPRFQSGQPWAGGIHEMAHAYVDILSDIVQRGGRVILGGWSLGGLIALEMAHIISTHPDISFTVDGIVMIDSIYPKPIIPTPGDSKDESIALKPAPFVPSLGKARPEVRTAIHRSFALSRAMIEAWTLPVWGQKKNSEAAQRYSLPPPTVLLRAKQAVPMSEPETIAWVDLLRKNPTLGWSLYYGKDGIQQVLDIPGHHYNIFELQHVEETTANLDKACRLLEQCSPRYTPM